MGSVKNKGWSVTFAGLGINLALGILYTWSIFRLEIKESIMAGDGRFTWDIACTPSIGLLSQASRISALAPSGLG